MERGEMYEFTYECSHLLRMVSFLKGNKLAIVSLLEGNLLYLRSNHTMILSVTLLLLEINGYVSSIY